MEIIVFIFNIIIAIVFKILTLILAPIDYLINASFPAIATALTAIGGFITTMASGLGWAISASGVPYSAIALVGTFWIFKLTLPFNVWLIKLAISWYKTLKP